MKIRELFTRWGFKTNTGPVTKLDRAIGGLKRAAGVTAKGLGILAGAAGAVGVGLFVAVKKSADFADKIAKASRRVGISAQTLMKLKHAAELSGTSLDEMITGLRRLAASAYDASQGSKAAQDAFDALGVTVKNTDGSLKSNEVLLRETLMALGDLEDLTLRAALAQKIYGRAGTSLLPMLEGGAFALAEMMRRAEELNLVLGKKALKGAENFNDALLDLKRSTGAVFMVTSAKLYPILTKVIKRIEGWVTANKELIAQKIANFVKDASAWFEKFFDSIKSEDIKEFIASIVSMADSLSVLVSLLRGIWSIFKTLGETIGIIFAKIYLDVEKFIGEIVWLGDRIGWVAAQAYLMGEKFIKILGAVWQMATMAFSGIKDIVFDSLSSIWGWLTEMPGRVWDGITGSFWKAIDAVKEKIFATYNWLKTKLGRFWDWLFGEEAGEKKLTIRVEEARAVARVIAAPAPAMAAAGVTPRGGAQIAYSPTINITVPPGTPRTEAERVKDATAKSTENSFRRALTDVQR